MIEELLAVYLIHLSYFALVFIPVISSMGFPFSEELVLLGAGYLISIGFIRWDLGIILCFIGIIAGDNSGYFIGWQGGKLFDYIVSERKLKKAKKFANKHGPKAVFIARFVPGLRFFMPLISGASRLKYRKFFFYNTLGALIVVPLGMGAGYYIGMSLDQIILFTQDLNVIIIVSALLLLSIAAIFVCFYRKYIRTKIRESNFYDRWLKKGEEPYQVVTLGNPNSSARQLLAKIRTCDGRVSCMISDVKQGSVKRFIKLKPWFSLRAYQRFVKDFAKKRRHKIEQWE
ncbi:DedA family protein [Candidatus Woesearchaeota archaeon]|nr:DedA family protein [Candidatus Woesearchaeota archaeon]MBW3006104.1 DedA family protein [Candidatus Woesearchaeota archaeon]